MKTILVPVDFSDVTGKIIEMAKTFAKAMGSHVVLLHVRQVEYFTEEQIPMASGSFVFTPPVIVRAETEATVQERLNEIILQFAGMPVEATTRQYEGLPLEMILQACEQEEADMIVMGSHGHGAIYNLLVGSVTEGVLKSAKCPVLVVPSPRAQ